MLTEVERAILRYKNAPQIGAFYKGLHYELNLTNPYIGNFKTLKNKSHWRKSFFNAFEKGRYLRKKYQLFEQKLIFNN